MIISVGGTEPGAGRRLKRRRGRCGPMPRTMEEAEHGSNVCPPINNSGMEEDREPEGRATERIEEDPKFRLDSVQDEICNGDRRLG